MKIMVSNGEIYHLAFQVNEELIKQGKHPSVVEIRDYLKELNKQGLSLEDMKNKAVEMAREKYKK